jgi:rhodanese-related sulfurtransferase
VAAERIPITDLKKKLDAKKNLILVDVREPSEIKEGGAIRARFICRWHRLKNGSVNCRGMPKSSSTEEAEGARRAQRRRY